jgi:hypothetical protein
MRIIEYNPKVFEEYDLGGIPEFQNLSIKPYPMLRRPFQLMLSTLLDNLRRFWLFGL